MVDFPQGVPPAAMLPQKRTLDVYRAPEGDQEEPIVREARHSLVGGIALALTLLSGSGWLVAWVVLPALGRSSGADWGTVIAFAVLSSGGLLGQIAALALGFVGSFQRRRRRTFGILAVVLSTLSLGGVLLNAVF